MMIENELFNLINSIQEIPPKDREAVSEYLKHREWGVAFEIFCSTLEQEKILVSRTQYEIIEKIGHLMNYEHTLWRRLLISDD